MLQRTGNFFTGMGARNMVIQNFLERNVPKPNLPKWKVFVQSRYLGCRHLDGNTTVLYEVAISIE